MAITILDAKGLKCPQPTMKVAIMAIEMKSGDVLEVVADCDTFEDDVRSWCTRARKVLLWTREEVGGKRCQIQF